MKTAKLAILFLVVALMLFAANPTIAQPAFDLTASATPKLEGLADPAEIRQCVDCRPAARES